MFDIAGNGPTLICPQNFLLTSQVKTVNFIRILKADGFKLQFIHPYNFLLTSQDKTVKIGAEIKEGVVLLTLPTQYTDRFKGGRLASYFLKQK